VDPDVEAVVELTPCRIIDSPNFRLNDCPLLLPEQRSIMVPQSQLEHVVNVQHRCSYRCQASSEQSVQERELSAALREILEHDHDVDVYVLNIYALGMFSLSMRYLTFQQFDIDAFAHGLERMANDQAPQ
jgi:hypothetical protein